MATTVKIIYTGPVVDVTRKGTAIMRIFSPDNSYVDTPVFTDGYANADTVGDKGTYGRSIYATNFAGWGELKGLLPMASTTTKFAQFERAVIAKFNAEAAGEKNEGITFDIDTYEDDIYWNQISANMWQDGFYIEVGDNKYGIEPEEES